LSIITNRISTSPLMNKKKDLFLKDYFNKVKQLKQNMSYYVLKKIQENDIHHQFFYELKSEYKNFSGLLSSWETQKLFHSIVDNYINQIQQRNKNKQFKIQKKIERQYYKRNGKNFKKGDLKYFQVVLKQTELTKLLNHLKYVKLNELETFQYSFEKEKNKLKELEKELEDNKNNLSEEEKEKLKDKISKTKTSIEILKSKNNFLNKLRKDKIKWNKIKKLIINFKQKIKNNISKIEYNTGSHIKSAVFNKNSNNPVIHSKIILNTNSKQKTSNLKKQKFPYFYKFSFNQEGKQETKYFPLSFNEKYHKFNENLPKTKDKLAEKNPFFEINNHINQKYDLNKEHYVTYKNNKLHIGLTLEKDEVIYKKDGEQIGIDINIRDNFLSLSTGEIIDYDRKYIKELVNELHRIDQLSKEEKKSKNNKRKLEKLVKRNEWYFKKTISEVLRKLDKDGISEISMEDLDLSKMKASFVKDKDLEIKFSRLVRILRLSNIKEWFKRQAENYGIKVHLTNSAYTSQECSKCHYISKKNRNKDKFKCIECGHEEHSDLNSPKVIKFRVFGSEVLCSKLHQFDNDNRLIPKKIKIKTIKKIVEDFFEKNPVKLSN